MMIDIIIVNMLELLLLKNVSDISSNGEKKLKDEIIKITYHCERMLWVTEYVSDCLSTMPWATEYVSELSFYWCGDAKPIVSKHRSTYQWICLSYEKR